MDTFLSQKYCDRCGKELTGGRTMSMFNKDCICMECKRNETELPEYQAAVKAELQLFGNCASFEKIIKNSLKKFRF